MSLPSPASPPRQRLWGTIVAVCSAMVFIYGAFYFAHIHTAATLNVPLWLGVAGMVLGAVLLVRGSSAAQPS